MLKVLSAILLGGIVAGALDITYACVHWHLTHGVAPTRIFQSVAAGLIGREAAVAGGWPTAMLGLGAHFALTIVMAAFFVAWTTMVPALNRWPLLAGVTYGLGLFVVMQLVVLPMSATGAAGEFPKGQFLLGGLLIHAFGVGLPIALIAKHFASD